MVTVIITTYNRKQFLEEAILSVLNQDYEDKEIIVVDDGSTDGSREVAEAFPVQYKWKQNEGISSGRNMGIGLARGNYLSFLDVDDLWHKEKLSVQMAEMEAGGFEISYTDEIWVRNGRRLNQKKRHAKYSGFIYDRCLPLCIISPSSAVIKRSIFEVVGLFDESLPVCEDYDMWLRICSRYPALFIPRPLITKRGGHNDQLSKNYEVMDVYRIKAMIKILESGLLACDMHRKTVTELMRKSFIVAKGCEKRGKFDEACYYYGLAARYTQ
jgi:glycosyltransferase involved in cell wall biosynthesis